MAKFGVLGSGEVGQTLAKGLRGIGHEVRIGSRDPKKLSGFTSETNIPNGTFAEVARWAEALVLAIKGGVAEDAMRQARTGESLREIDHRYHESHHRRPTAGRRAQVFHRPQ